MVRRSSINQTEWFRNCWRNRLQTALLLSFLAGYLFLVGWLIWGSAVTVWLLAVSAVVFLLVPTGSPDVLMKLSGGRRLERLQHPALYRLTDDLARTAELEQAPKLYLLPTRQPNALAAGNRNEPIIAVSHGLLQLLDRRELAGVLAHEVSHLRHDDIRVMRLADSAARLTGSISLFGQILLLLNLPLLLFSEQSFNWLPVLILIFAPQVSSLAQLRLSRVREFNADLGAASLTKDPEGLASALQKIESSVGGVMQRFFGRYRMLPDWLRTHPPTRERVLRLLELTEYRVEESAMPSRAGGWQLRPASARMVSGLNPRPIPVVFRPPTRRPRCSVGREWYL